MRPIEPQNVPQDIQNLQMEFTFEHFLPILKEVDRVFPAYKIMKDFQNKPEKEATTEIEQENDMKNKFDFPSRLKNMEKGEFRNMMAQNAYFRTFIHYVDYYFPTQLAANITAFTHTIFFDQRQVAANYPRGVPTFNLETLMLNMSERCVSREEVWENAISNKEFRDFLRFLYRRCFAIFNGNHLELFRGSLVF